MFKNARFGIRVDSSATLCVSGRLALNGNSTWQPNVTRGGWYLTTDKILTNQVDMLENLYRNLQSNAICQLLTIPSGTGCCPSRVFLGKTRAIGSVR